MITFLAPGYLLAAGAAALAVVALHLLSTREPRLEELPTTRFIPEAPLQALSLTLRPSDLVLLLLRLLLILLLGAALARPVWGEGRVAVARIVAVDISRAVGTRAEVIDSVQAYLDGAAAVLLFSDTVREVPVATALDSLATSLEAESRRAPIARPGSLSAALIAAQRTAAQLRDRADSLELVLVSAFVAEERDAATTRVRALWPGGIRMVPVSPALPPEPAQEDELNPAVRVAWADSGAATGWRRRPAPDTVGAVRAGDAVLVYPFVREWEWGGEDGVAGTPATAAAPRAATNSNGNSDAPAAEQSMPPATRVYALWLDGEPAAFEWLDADTCVRTLGFALPAEGDAALRPEFQRFLAELQAPCGTPPRFEPLNTKFMNVLAGAATPAATEQLARAEVATTPLMRWLLAAAILVALAELMARHRQRHGSQP